MAKMSRKKMLEKVHELKHLEQQIAELQAAADEIKDALKAAMEQAGADEMQLDIFTLRYKTVASARFDSAAFKAKYGDLYAQYTRCTECKRFTVTA